MMADARADAVEAAALALINQDRRRFELPPHASPSDAFDQGQKAMGIATIAIDAYLASMSGAGWVMVEDAGEMENNGTWDDYRNGERDGWNACRAAMLADPQPKR